MDYNFAKNARECSVTHHVFAPGETFYSLLIEETNGRFTRRDYSVESWKAMTQDPAHSTNGIVGFWKSKIPNTTSTRQRWAPNEILLRYFEELENRPDCDDTRYVLALLLVRRRLLVCDDETRTDDGRSFLMLRDPKRELNFEVEVLPPSTERYDAIQQQLAELLQ